MKNYFTTFCIKPILAFLAFQMCFLPDGRAQATFEKVNICNLGNADLGSLRSCPSLQVVDIPGQSAKGIIASVEYSNYAPFVTNYNTFLRMYYIGEDSSNYRILQTFDAATNYHGPFSGITSRYSLGAVTKLQARFPAEGPGFQYYRSVFVPGDGSPSSTTYTVRHFNFSSGSGQFQLLPAAASFGYNSWLSADPAVPHTSYGNLKAVPDPEMFVLARTTEFLVEGPPPSYLIRYDLTTGTNTKNDTIALPAHFRMITFNSDADAADELHFLISGNAIAHFDLDTATHSLIPLDTTYTDTFSVSGFRAADVNGDGREDLLLTSTNNDLVYMEQQPDGSFPDVQFLMAGAGSVYAFGDLDNDGLKDLLWYTSGTLRLKKNLGGAVFAADYVIASTPAIRQLQIVDFDDDGKNDIVPAAIINGGIAYLRNAGTDSFPPTAVCTDTITVEIGANGTVNIPGAALDAGSFDETVVTQLLSSPATASCDDIPELTATLIVRDGSGNSDSCTAIVKVRDVTPPTLSCRNITVDIAIGDSVILHSDSLVTATENCGESAVTIDPSMIYASDAQQVSVTVTATDAYGNISTCTSIVTVEILTATNVFSAGLIRSLVPNPARDQVLLTLDEAPAGGYDIRVFNASGQIALEQNQVTGPQQMLQVGGLPTGVYFVVVRSSSDQQVLGRDRLVVSQVNFEY